MFKRALLSTLLTLCLLTGLATTSHAVVSSTINQNKYACNSLTTSWNYTFPIILSTDIQVYTIDSSGNLTQQLSNFSVNTVTQSVTYPVTGTPCATGSYLLLLRVEPFTQQVAASNQGPAPSPVVMTMSDKLTMLAQQLQNSSIQTAPGTSSAVVFPVPSPGSLIGWTSTGLLGNIPNPTATAQWTLSGADISYNTGNVSTTNNMTAATFNGNLNGGINWADLPGVIPSGSVNWNDIGKYGNLNSGGINWNDTNLHAIINFGGINWTSIKVFAAHWSGGDHSGINWQSFGV